MTTFDLDFLNHLEHELQSLAAREAAPRRARLIAPTRRALLALTILLAAASLSAAALAAGLDPTSWFSQSGGPTGGALTSNTFHVNLQAPGSVLGPVPATLNCNGDAQQQNCIPAAIAAPNGSAYTLLSRAGAPDATHPAQLTGSLDPTTLTAHDRTFALIAAAGQQSPNQTAGLPPFIACLPTASAWLCRPLLNGATLAGGTPIYQNALG
jgi:hypothetical protein